MGALLHTTQTSYLVEGGVQSNDDSFCFRSCGLNYGVGSNSLNMQICLTASSYRIRHKHRLLFAYFEHPSLALRSYVQMVNIWWTQQRLLQSPTAKMSTPSPKIGEPLSSLEVKISQKQQLTKPAVHQNVSNDTWYQKFLLLAQSSPFVKCHLYHQNHHCWHSHCRLLCCLTYNLYLVTVLNPDPGNITCRLFCDSIYVSTMTCENGNWTGHPELGAW